MKAKVGWVGPGKLRGNGDEWLGFAIVGFVGRGEGTQGDHGEGAVDGAM